MKNEEFHIPFIKSMVIVGLTTVLLMFFTRIIVENYLFTPYKTQEFTTAPFSDNTKSTVVNGL